MRQKGRYINGRYVVYRPTKKEIERANDFYRPQEIETGRSKTNEKGNGIKPIGNGGNDRGF